MTLVTITLDAEKAERLSDGIADALCWLAGYRSARPDDADLSVINIEALRAMNLTLKDALARHDNEPKAPKQRLRMPTPVMKKGKDRNGY